MTSKPKGKGQVQSEAHTKGQQQRLIEEQRQKQEQKQEQKLSEETSFGETRHGKTIERRSTWSQRQREVKKKNPVHGQESDQTFSQRHWTEQRRRSCSRCLNLRTPSPAITCTTVLLGASIAPPASVPSAIWCGRAFPTYKHSQSSMHLQTESIGSGSFYRRRKF